MQALKRCPLMGERRHGGFSAGPCPYLVVPAPPKITAGRFRCVPGSPHSPKCAGKGMR